MNKIVLILFIVISFPLLSNEKGTLTITTLNLWHYPNDYINRVKNLESEDKILNSDIYGFQEAWTLGEKSLYKFILNKKKYFNCYVKTNALPFFEEGLALISRYPFDKCYSIDLPSSHKSQHRKALIASIKINQRDLNVINVHLSPFESGRDARMIEIKRLVLEVKKLNPSKPIVIMGDFNEDYNRVFYSGLFDQGFESVIDQNTCTYCKDNHFTDGRFDSSLDNVFYSTGSIKIRDRNIVFENNLVSDHYGVFAQLEVSEGI